MNNDLSSFSISLHGWDEKIDFGQLLPVFGKYFHVAGIEPNLSDFRTRESGRVQVLAYQTVLKRISSGQLRGLSELSLYHLADKADKQSHIFAISLGESLPDRQMDNRTDQNGFFINGVTSLETAKVLAFEFIQDILGYVSPVYGYSLQMPLSYDPAFFSAGMFAREERMRPEIDAWQEASHAAIGGTKHREGFFRHVFEFNILSSPHVLNKIDGQTFESWVGQHRLGKLENLNNKVWLWTVPKSERIRAAKALQRNGLLTAPKGFENELIG
jgi:hypothetical protein